MLWDDRHGMAITEWNTVADVEVGDEPARWYVRPARPGGLGVNALFVPKGGDRLTVSLHGALNREKFDPPRFEWLSTLRHRPESVLLFADETITTDPDMAIGWYVGTERDDHTRRVAAVIRHVARALGVSQVVAVGASGGGYAALQLALRVPGVTGIAFSPQTRIRAYGPPHSTRLVERGFPSMPTVEAAEAAHLERLSLVDRVKSRPAHARLVYVQNANDPGHIRMHLTPFLEAVGMDGPGLSPDGTIRVDVNPYSEGHGAPPRDEVTRYIDAAFAGELGLSDSPPPPGSLQVLIYGSCVSRDTVEHMADGIASRYIARQSLISAAAPPATFPDVEFPTRFQRRMVRDDFHSTAFAALRAAAPHVDVLVLDLIDERLGVIEVDGRWVTRSQEFRESTLPGATGAGRILRLGDDEHFDLWKAAATRLVGVLEEADLTDRTVVIQAPFARVDERGESAPWFEKTPPDVWDTRFARYYDVLRGAGLRVHTIESPVTALGHRWGPAAYHYTASAYSAAADALRRVASRP